jgi:hypothetical protein
MLCAHTPTSAWPLIMRPYKKRLRQDTLYCGLGGWGSIVWMNYGRRRKVWVRFIRVNNHRLITNLITWMDGKARDESISLINLTLKIVYCSTTL